MSFFISFFQMSYILLRLSFAGFQSNGVLLVFLCFNAHEQRRLELEISQPREQTALVWGSHHDLLGDTDNNWDKSFHFGKRKQRLEGLSSHVHMQMLLSRKVNLILYLNVKL